jgi:hypothetical protein
MAYTTIDNPELYFQAKLYTGSGSIQAITLDGDEDMQPDLVIQKDRGNVRHHNVYDSVRGVKARLRADATNAEYTADATNGFDSFDSDGFTLEADSSSLGTNEDTEDYVAWCWKESATAGFDIVQFTGNDTARTISHNLSAVPGLIICKNPSEGAAEWPVYHHKNTTAPETERLFLSGTQATLDNATFFNDTAPTTSVFSVGTSSDINGNTNSIISYVFAEKQGYSKFGSYTGNGNADGPFIYTGFRPAFLITKRTDGVAGWSVKNNKTDPENPVDRALFANATDAEATDQYIIDFLSNGFKIRDASAGVNGSGSTYIYMAFAEAPFVNSNGVPCNAR